MFAFFYELTQTKNRATNSKREREIIYLASDINGLFILILKEEIAYLLRQKLHDIQLIISTCFSGKT